MMASSEVTDPRIILPAGRLIARDRAPYLRAVLHGLSMLETPGLGTIGVTKDGILLIDWAFVARLTPDEMAGALIHECLHVLLNHCERTERLGLDPRLSNRAQDLAINPAVLDMGFVLPGGGPGVTMDHPLHPLYPVDLGFSRGLTSEEYYDLLRQMKPRRRPKAPRATGTTRRAATARRSPPRARDGAGRAPGARCQASPTRRTAPTMAQGVRSKRWHGCAGRSPPT